MEYLFNQREAFDLCVRDEIKKAEERARREEEDKRKELEDKLNKAQELIKKLTGHALVF